MVRFLAGVNAAAQTYFGAVNDWPTKSVVVVAVSWAAFVILMVVRRTR